MTIVDVPGNRSHGVEAVDVPLPSLGLYSHAVRAPLAHRLLAISGQLSVDSEGKSVGVGDFEAQMRQVLSNLAMVLAADGMRPVHLLKMTSYVTSPELISEFYRVRALYWGEWFPDGVFPGNTLLVVSRLVQPEFMLEIEGLAAAPTTSV